MKILIAGCSFATEMAQLLRQRIPRCKVLDVAASAAGNKFIADSVILSTLKYKFDAIYVSWSGLSRYDVPITDTTCFDDWTSKAKIQEKDYIFTGGIWSWDHHKHPFANMLFRDYHKFVDQKELQYNSLLEMVKLKGYLDSLKVPYYFTTMINQFNDTVMELALERAGEISARTYSEHLPLIDYLEIDQWLLKDGLGIFETMYNENLISQDDFHPTTEGYKMWIDLFVQRLNEDNII